MNEKKLISTFALFGVIAGIGYWLYLYISDPGTAPAPSDIFDYAQSYFVRGYLFMKGQAQSIPGVTSDPVSIAAGLIAEEESYSSKVYPDPAGQTVTYSIGYGHQLVPGDGFTRDSRISQSDALALLQNDLQRFVQCVDSGLTVELSPAQLAALYDFCYNVGCAAFSESTLLQDINAGADSGTVANDLARWVHANGNTSEALQARRQKEADLYASGTPATNQGSQYVAQYGPDAGANPGADPNA